MELPEDRSINNMTYHYYKSDYNDVHYTGIQGIFTKSYHKRLEKGKFLNRLIDPRILEVGAGAGQHIPFVTHKYSHYVFTDIQNQVDGYLDLLGIETESKNRVQFRLADASKLDFSDNSFDRVISTCLLHHLSEPSVALEEWRRVVKNGGVISIYLPCDPGMIYRWVRHVTSHLKQERKMGISGAEVKFLWANEHKGHILGLLKSISWIFRRDEIQIKRFPFPFLSWNFNFYMTVQISVKKSD